MNTKKNGGTKTWGEWRGGGGGWEKMLQSAICMVLTSDNTKGLT